MQNWPLPKDPQDKCKLRFDWSNRLEDGDTISSATYAVAGSSTLEIDNEAIDGAYSTFRVTGGAHGEVADITCHVVMSNGDEWDQTGKLRIRSA